MEQNWIQINAALPSMREDQVSALLDKELDGQRRWSVIERLHQRLSNLRRDREREELRVKYKKSPEPTLL